MIQPQIEIEFDWHLTNRCNFYCEYCHPHIRKVLNSGFLTEPDYETIIKRFNDIDKPCLIHMSGGEPFLYPNFVKMCKGLTEHHYISINSNLSVHTIPQFVEDVNPKKVTLITAAIHQIERERQGKKLDDYVIHYKMFRDKGFNIKALYIVFPPLVKVLGQHIKYLKESGVDNLIAKVFKGVYNGKRYPESYTVEEQEEIIKHAGDYKFNKPYMEGQMTFTGQLCTAGMSSFKINVNGDVQRCASVKGNYGNLYEGTFNPTEKPTPCTANRVLVVSQCHRFLVNSPIKVEDIQYEEED